MPETGVSAPVVAFAVNSAYGIDISYIRFGNRLADLAEQKTLLRV